MFDVDEIWRRRGKYWPAKRVKEENDGNNK